MRTVVGQVLGGRYRLVELIATGGMGEVWAAEDLSLHRFVAVKVLREQFTGHEEFLRRLRTEARNSAALAHPNIAQMFDYGEQDGTGYLVMELVRGEPLADLIERDKTLPPQRLLPILEASARGLHHAHLAGVVHRDVKPGNILLEGSPDNADPTVKITDFGVSLAENQAPMTATGMVMGTAQYLSPEQAIGKPATPRSDLYALGVLAYEATAGRRPFTGKSPVDIAIAHVNDPVPPLPLGTDPRVSALIMRLLDKDPENRPANAGALADEIKTLREQMLAPPARQPVEPPPIIVASTTPFDPVAAPAELPPAVPVGSVSPPDPHHRNVALRSQARQPASEPSAPDDQPVSVISSRRAVRNSPNFAMRRVLAVAILLLIALILFLIVRGFTNQVAAFTPHSLGEAGSIDCEYSTLTNLRCPGATLGLRIV